MRAAVTGELWAEPREEARIEKEPRFRSMNGEVLFEATVPDPAAQEHYCPVNG